MKIHGLVILVALSLSKPVLSQETSTAQNETFLPPSPRNPDDERDRPKPLPQSVPVAPAGSPVDMETELKQFRSELREFQVMREDVARSTKTAEADADRITLQQRQELVDLLSKLATKAATLQKSRVAEPRVDGDQQSQLPRVVPSVPPLDVSTNSILSDSASIENPNEIADPFALGKVLFRAGDFVGAERAFRRATVESENEMTLKYLLATCLRRQSRWKESMAGYKAVAESNQDAVLRDLAKWQMDNIRWVQESESQLKKMRQQRDKQPAAKNDQSSDLNAGK